MQIQVVFIIMTFFSLLPTRTYSSSYMVIISSRGFPSSLAQAHIHSQNAATRCLISTPRSSCKASSRRPTYRARYPLPGPKQF